MTSFIFDIIQSFKTLSVILCLFAVAIFSSLTIWAEDLPDGLYAQMQTSKGKIVLRLFYQKVPVTVSNFVGLAEGTKEWKDPETRKAKKTRFFDGLSFHRVIKDFMIQGGDPLGNGNGGPGYKFADEFHPELKHNKPGILSMANSGPHTNGSQFFITHVPTPHLDNKHSVFGEVFEGMNVVNSIKKGDLIQEVTIIRKGGDARGFDPAIAEKLIQERNKKLAAKNKKNIPQVTTEFDPAKIPHSDNTEAAEVSIEMLVVAFQGARTPKKNLFYDKSGAEEIAKKLTDLARRKNINFTELINQFTDLPQQSKLPLLSANQTNLPEFLKPALKLGIGQISDPVDSPFGYLIFHRVSVEIVSAKHILITFDGALRATKKREKKEARKLAEQILEDLKKGKVFAKLARTYSDGPSGPKGGNLGRFTRGQMVPEFDQAVFNLNPGEVSGVVETQFGYHIIKRVK